MKNGANGFEEVKKSINKNLLIIFVKNAELGTAKTRLAKTVGDENALRVYQKLVSKTREIALAVEANTAVYYSTYIDEYDQFSQENFAKRLQMGDDLGERMKNAVQTGFNQGFEKVAIIGSDCWDLTSEIVQSAFSALDTNDVVFGPAKDGGYYLLAMRLMVEELFENKTWSTDNVLVDSILDVEQKNLTKSLLPTLSDVDYESDLPAELRSILQ